MLCAEKRSYGQLRDVVYTVAAVAMGYILQLEKDRFYPRNSLEHGHTLECVMKDRYYSL